MASVHLRRIQRKQLEAQQQTISSSYETDVETRTLNIHNKFCNTNAQMYFLYVQLFDIPKTSTVKMFNKSKD